MSSSVKMHEVVRGSAMLFLYASLARVWLAASAAPAAGDAVGDRYQLERQLIDLLKELQDKRPQQQQAPAANPSAGTAANIDRVAGGDGGAAATHNRDDYAEPPPQPPYRGANAYPANLVRNPEGRSAYTNRCRGDPRMCMNSYRIGSKRDEPSNSDLVPALEALSDVDDLQQQPQPLMYRSERRVRVELIKRKLLDLYDDVRELEREYAI